MNVEGTSALVTGAASGLGEATARMLVARGAKVTILDFNGEGAQRVAEDIGGLAVKCDVASAESGEAAVAKSIDAFGRRAFLSIVPARLRRRRSCPKPG